MKPKPNNDWLAALESCMAMDAPGPEWKTRRQLEAEFNLHRRSVERALRKMLESDKAEMKMFALSKDGPRRVVPHYRLIK